MKELLFAIILDTVFNILSLTVLLYCCKHIKKGCYLYYSVIKRLIQITSIKQRIIWILLACDVFHPLFLFCSKCSIKSCKVAYTEKWTYCCKKMIVHIRFFQYFIFWNYVRRPLFGNIKSIDMYNLNNIISFIFVQIVKKFPSCSIILLSKKAIFPETLSVHSLMYLSTSCEPLIMHAFCL